ncbi:MAG: glycosyltransferase [Candidatus Levybacteria bacterium]|nr:glycosyltransferase [Candidatus Levybacteria bacterium]
MRVGIFDPYLDTLSGGEKYMLSIATCLASSNEVFIFWDKEKEVKIKQVALDKLGVDLSPVNFYPNIFNKNVSPIRRFIESKNFDVIIYLSDGSIPLVGTKLYLHFQFPIEWVNGNSLKTKIKLLRVNTIFCNSYFTKNFIDKKLMINSKVLYPPVKINSQKIKKENIILHVGRFDENHKGVNYKKQDLMIKIFKKMMGQGLKGWKFILLVGVKSDDEEKFNKFKNNFKNYPVTIIENPDNKTLWEWYSKSKIYWHATGFGEDLQKYPEKAEHFGMSTVEAMGSGAVPVVINEGGQIEIVENGKNGYLWSTLEDFEAKTNELIKDNKLWGEMSKNAIEKSKIFNGERFCVELKKIIK